MKRTFMITTAAVLFASAPFAFGEEHTAGGDTGAGPAASEESRSSVGGAAPITEHQSEALREEEQQFAQLDEDGDGQISYEEAQRSEPLKSYWEERQMDPSQHMDRAEFAQFISSTETGTQIYDGGQGTGGMPSSEHQEEATGEGPAADPDAPRSGGEGAR